MASPRRETSFRGPLVESAGLRGDRKSRANVPLDVDLAFVKEVLDFVDIDEYNTTNWTLTAVEAGSGSASVAVAAGVKNGELLLTNDDADNDSINLQKKVEAWKLESGKRLWFEASFKGNDVDQSDIFIGLAKTDTTALDSSDRIGFRITDGDASINIESIKNSAGTDSDSSVDAVDDTLVKVGFIFDGDSSVEFFINGNSVGTSTTIPDDEELAITINLTNGEAAAQTMSIDYIAVVKER